LAAPLAFVEALLEAVEQLGRQVRGLLDLLLEDSQTLLQLLHGAA